MQTVEACPCEDAYEDAWERVPCVVAVASRQPLNKQVSVVFCPFVVGVVNSRLCRQPVS